MISLDKLREVYLANSQSAPEAHHAAGNYPSVMGLLAVYDLGWQDGNERRHDE